MTPQHRWLHRLMSLYAQGCGSYALMMGLSPQQWTRLPYPARQRLVSEDALRRHQLMSELMATRRDEQQQLALWLAEYMHPDADPMHCIVASVALAFNHLWEDLGLSSRAELRQLMSDCFPELVVMNDKNMRWKKFFYRQRCLHAEGELICRSPSCDACCERGVCFDMA
ncbi:nitrogen fixation protein NifQ [Pantoea phytobeneficialis]|uniref:Nitrogen fixation protein NifQ n=1 Tax=Pantoea phytobeneficialis TaxID=2052056 RepID=A0AAP9HB11_9GAMM|nr:nitrogen fixation protein NifQ [Pantoea phytobeneficialis]MDO6409918.1 nitrogen fixation protein NifQ [Pantoea phytobeneficialis]QGR09801.1 nitrogen fixation protein NifQ [Pantoea phytobeneficialis]